MRVSICIAAIVASFAILLTNTAAQGPPETPQNARPTGAISWPPQNGIEIIIEWDVVADADEYEVRWVRGGEEERVVVPREDWEGTQQAYRDYWLANPEPGIYDFAVRARNALGNSEWSHTVRHHVRDTPAQPQAVVDGADLLFSWFRPNGATSFEICWMREYGGCNDPYSFARLTETSLRIPNALPGEYQVMLRESGDWVSDWSPWTFVVVPNRGSPASALTDEPKPRDSYPGLPTPYEPGSLPSPERLRAYFNGSSLRLEWDPVPEDGVYDLCKVRPYGGCWKANSTYKTLQGLPAGTHYFRVLPPEHPTDDGTYRGPWSDEVAVDVPAMHSHGLSASAIAIEPAGDANSYWLVTAEWRGVAGAERYQVHWLERHPGFTVTHPVVFARRPLEDERPVYTAQLRTRRPPTLQISLRVEVDGEWSTWTEWLALDAAPQEPAGGD